MSAVLILIVITEAGCCFLLEVRSESVRQPGEICFPGGRMEPGETPVQTALRETEEELGIPADRITVVGELAEERMFSGRMIHPVVGVLPEELLSEGRLSEAEGADAFLLPAAWLRDHEPDRYDFAEAEDEDLPDKLLEYMSHYDRGVRRVGGTLYWEYGEHAVWGLTARILERALHEIDFAQISSML